MPPAVCAADSALLQLGGFNMNLKGILCSVIGMGGAFVSRLFGGWTGALTTLAVFMAIDFISGLAVAGIFGKSSKTENGAMESNACWKGLCRKVVTLLIVLIAHRLDLMLGSCYLKDAVTIAFCINEVISIIENAGLMGIPIPEAIKNAIEVLKTR